MSDIEGAISIPVRNPVNNKALDSRRFNITYIPANTPLELLCALDGKQAGYSFPF